ncbi:hypothetical protein DFP72DRAFT_1066731 [Ephemerocybe angulata]|uniref:Uncharacterized protein n=1 Tax=Ephemerocybe angulata TaxID=980116 RepID=A0A8H6HZZ3_9AGAR|nr:hypothetical protein DFP72DRAFT_1066731 [Tulosesus angulatus]
MQFSAIRFVSAVFVLVSTFASVSALPTPQPGAAEIAAREAAPQACQILNACH